MDLFTINEKIKKEKISWKEIDKCIEKINNSKDDECKREYNILIKYVLQRMYVSGKKETSTEEVHTKIKDLLISGILEGLQNKDIIETLTDEDGEEYFRLTEFGKAVAKEMRETNGI